MLPIVIGSQGNALLRGVQRAGGIIELHSQRAGPQAKPVVVILPYLLQVQRHRRLPGHMNGEGIVVGGGAGREGEFVKVYRRSAIGARRPGQLGFRMPVRVMRRVHHAADRAVTGDGQGIHDEARLRRHFIGDRFAVGHIIPAVFLQGRRLICGIGFIASAVEPAAAVQGPVPPGLDLAIVAGGGADTVGDAVREEITVGCSTAIGKIGLNPGLKRLRIDDRNLTRYIRAVVGLSSGSRICIKRCAAVAGHQVARYINVGLRAALNVDALRPLVVSVAVQNAIMIIGLGTS